MPRPDDLRISVLWTCAFVPTLAHLRIEHPFTGAVKRVPIDKSRVMADHRLGPLGRSACRAQVAAPQISTSAMRGTG